MLHERPTAAQLVEAVREFLERDVMAATGGRVQFHTRVAVNALRMVERELAVGQDQQQDYDARLARAGYGTEEDLARAIREGIVGLDDDEVFETLRSGVLAKLAVANPRYLAPEDSPGS